jgi:hypothetical protein
MKSKIWPIIIGIGAIGVMVFVGYALTRPDTTPQTRASAGQASSKSVNNNSDIVSDKEIHWHPELTIYINGQKQEIPASIGLGKQYAKNQWYDPMMQMTDVHTHDNDGTLHWEVMKDKTPVTKDHVQLKVLFDVWGKNFSKTELLDKTDASGSKITMKVNGQPNTEFENHAVVDKEKIEIRYQD